MIDIDELAQKFFGVQYCCGVIKQRNSSKNDEKKSSISERFEKLSEKSHAYRRPIPPYKSSGQFNLCSVDSQ
jgi:hypothetical protein